jgi:hypothetical protein
LQLLWLPIGTLPLVLMVQPLRGKFIWLLQLIIGDSPLKISFNILRVSGTFQMGTPDCPIQSGITVTVPGGDERYGIDVDKGAKYDVHGAVQVLSDQHLHMHDVKAPAAQSDHPATCYFLLCGWSCDAACMA